MTAEEREYFIRRRAYELWEARGCKDGCSGEDWLRAEREFDGIDHDALLPSSLSAEAHRERFRRNDGRTPASAMQRFRVRFFETLLGGNHHEADTCRWEGEAIAENSAAALHAAEQQFCQVQNLRHWSLHADRHGVTVAEASANTSMTAKKEVTMAAIDGKAEDLVGTARSDDQRRASTDPQEAKRLQALRASHRSHYCAGMDDLGSEPTEVTSDTPPTRPESPGLNRA